MDRIKWIVVIMALVATGTLYADNDVTTGMIEEYQPQQTMRVELPANFNVEQARSELRAARQDGDQARVQLIASQLSAWWQQNASQTHNPDAQGNNSPNPGRQNIEKDNPMNNNAPDWGTDVRMDPRDNVYEVSVTSISNGDLYAFCKYVDGGGTDYGVLLRSIDGGLTWNLAWDNSFGTTDIYDLGIVNDNDTLITWYILHNTSANTYRTWVRVCNSDASCTAIYWGSPTGGFNPIEYTDLFCCTDAAVWGTTEYVYATWTETYGSGPDSTLVMNAVSYENDVSAWELGPTRLTNTNGANIYYAGNEIAFGSGTDRMWLISWLHPYNYPTSFDRTVKGWYSDDFGSTWSARIDITPNNNALDEFDCAIAGAHTNTNWVVLATQVDTAYLTDRDVNCWYSTDDGATWTMDLWVSNSYENFFGDVWVDDNSTAFYGALRQNTGTAEYVRIKNGDIGDPTSWSGSLGINDNTSNLSDVYGPSVSCNAGLNEAIMAWVDYDAGIYSVWFDSEGWTGVAERPGPETSPLAIGLAPNPARSTATLSFTTQSQGRVTVALYDATGRLVETLVNDARAAGTYATTIDSRNIAAGIYFVRVETPDGVGTKTMTIVR